MDNWEHWEEIRLLQLAKKKWLHDGNQNSKYFHDIVNQRRKINVIFNMILEYGSRLEGPEEVHQGAISHFQSFLSQPNNVEELDLSSLIETYFRGKKLDPLPSPFGREGICDITFYT